MSEEPGSEHRLPGGCELKRFTIRGDERGLLIALEEMREAPFPIARVYYVYATRPGVDRGFHAHRDLQQMAVSVSGGCTMLVDDGTTRAQVRLDRPEIGLTIPPMVWHEMSDFTPDCVLMVLANAPYEEKDYIRDYQRFLSAARA